MNPSKQTKYNSRRDAEKLGGKPHTGVTIASLGIGASQNQPISQRKTRVETDANGSRVLVDAETGRAIYWLPDEPTAEESAEAQRLLAITFPRTISPETWDAAQEELARLSARVRELEEYTAIQAEVVAFVKRHPEFAYEFPSTVTVTAVGMPVEGGKNRLINDDRDLGGECIGGDGEGG